jgi:predicted lactoylglutathione lyase
VLIFKKVHKEKVMKLGCFSMSLAVKDLKKSKAFYEKLGFEVYAGQESHNFLIMKNGQTNIGLFQGMFEKNILTFNPGWDQDAKNITPFDDVRELREKLISSGVEIAEDSVTGDKGPSSFSVIDPDGNPVLIDQHV